MTNYNFTLLLLTIFLSISFQKNILKKVTHDNLTFNGEPKCLDCKFQKCFNQEGKFKNIISFDFFLIFSIKLLSILEIKKDHTGNKLRNNEKYLERQRFLEYPQNSATKLKCQFFISYCNTLEDCNAKKGSILNSS